MAHNSSSTTAAVAPHLSRNDKLRKALRELHVDALLDSTPHKRPLISLVCKYIDVFAESDSDVGTTSLTFHEIDTVTRARFVNLFVDCRMAKSAKQ